MRTTVEGYFALLAGETYLVLDEDKYEIGKLEVLENLAVITIGNETTKLKEDEIQPWFEENKYILTKTSPRFIEFNPNPSKNVKANDCTIRAYCAAEKLDWDAAYDIACKYGKKGTYMPNDKDTVHNILEQEFGYIKHRISKEDKGMTVADFAIKYDVGTYYVMVNRHIVAVVDGKYYDTWDSGKKKVSCYYSRD